MDDPAAAGAGTRRLPRRRLLGLDPDSNVVSLLWAAPFMAFLYFPLAAAVEIGLGTVDGALVFWPTLAFAAVYVVCWLANPPAPVTGTVTFRLVACIGALIVLEVFTSWAVVRAGGEGSTFLFSYVAAAWVMLCPRRLLLPGIAAILALALAQVLVLNPTSGELASAALSAGMAATLCYIARRSIDFDRRTTTEHRQALALSRERERSRISADLHDILGHTLTGITVKADLAGRLLDAGRTQDARAQLDDLTELARTALGDVRGVVAANRALTPAAEIDAARGLLDSTGVALDAQVRGEPPVGEASTLVAHVIREATTNAVLHAEPSHVGVEVRRDGVTVRNDGYSRRLSEATSGGGNGLPGLRERLRPGDHLEWGPAAGGQWVVRLELAP